MSSSRASSTSAATRVRLCPGSGLPWPCSFPCKPSSHADVTTVDSAQEGLKELKKSTFHLVLADVKMPGMNGLEFLEKLVMDKAYNFADLTVVSACHLLPVCDRSLS